MRHTILERAPARHSVHPDESNRPFVRFRSAHLRAERTPVRPLTNTVKQRSKKLPFRKARIKGLAARGLNPLRYLCISGCRAPARPVAGCTHLLSPRRCACFNAVLSEKGVFLVTAPGRRV